MDLYESWFYVHVINSSWLVWTLVVAIFGVNFLMPVLIWFLMADRNPLKMVKGNGENRKDEETAGNNSGA